MTEQQIIVTLATKVMGWKQYDETDFWFGDNGNLFNSSLWNPLQNIADAWQLMEKLKQRYFCEVVMTEGEDGYYHWMARFTEVLESPYQVNRFKAIEKTAPAAISKAAYKLVAEHNGNFRKGTEA
ncbi:BC1872 family protein [Brevibacillus laterosporus]|uniref:Phage ABA sandwich domain-containing protein n=1 Tax=Brevibacillus laterosporus TaxID=1465 RepID=A0AAP3GCV0_BRELA|nr:hypothetical protein [Brevibacillus laterosporus]MCR8983206.1 hypothetical protein [Brevibacillus laterosporus]MCR8997952.1 hypothetical protein [Brevibacillus laterosporus]MCZ0810362.1 hypothetical protein [Brevibacillus laterosporus]MCZ0828250.1 hypothetical protein [Brevibacillus laterosporus]MCZ0853100.1 hypothetical protein [Brevibacillus laterosporus]